MKSRRIFAMVLSVLLILALMPTGALAQGDQKEKAFADMPDDWSTAALEKAVGNGLLSGYDEKGAKLIKASNNLTRAEMAAVVNRAFASAKEADITKVNDVKASDWFAKDLAKAVKMETFAYDTKMRPKDKISRQEAFTVLARAFKLVGDDSNHKALNAFSDKGEIAAWALDSLDGMAAAGYVQGSGGKLNPKANITRAEFAVVMDNLVKEYIDSADTVTKVVANGNVMVRKAGTTLKDVTVKGDLIIADGVGEGDVTLDNVKVEGRTVVRGGGVNSIIIKGNSDLGKIIVSKVDGKVRISVEGGADVDVIYVDDGSDDVIVEGKAGTLEVAGDGITVTAINARFKAGIISGEDSRIIVDENSSVDKITVTGSNAKIEGKGEVKEVDIKAGGDKASVNTPNTITKVAEGIKGVTAGGVAVPGGSTATNNATGTGTTVTQPSIGGGGGGGSSSTTVVVSAISISGSLLFDHTLTAETSPASVTIDSYQWMVSDALDGAYVDIPGEINKTMTLNFALWDKLWALKEDGQIDSVAYHDDELYFKVEATDKSSKTVTSPARKKNDVDFMGVTYDGHGRVEVIGTLKPGKTVTVRAIPDPWNILLGWVAEDSKDSTNVVNIETLIPGFNKESLENTFKVEAEHEGFIIFAIFDPKPVDENTVLLLGDIEISGTEKTYLKYDKSGNLVPGDKDDYNVSYGGQLTLNGYNGEGIKVLDKFGLEKLEIGMVEDSKNTINGNIEGNGVGSGLAFQGEAALEVKGSIKTNGNGDILFREDEPSTINIVNGGITAGGDIGISGGEITISGNAGGDSVLYTQNYVEISGDAKLKINSSNDSGNINGIYAKSVEIKDNSEVDIKVSSNMGARGLYIALENGTIDIKDNAKVNIETTGSGTNRAVYFRNNDPNGKFRINGDEAAVPTGANYKYPTPPTTKIDTVTITGFVGAVTGKTPITKDALKTTDTNYDIVGLTWYEYDGTNQTVMSIDVKFKDVSAYSYEAVIELSAKTDYHFVPKDPGQTQVNISVVPDGWYQGIAWMESTSEKLLISVTNNPSS